jgi:hypothetical protein
MKTFEERIQAAADKAHALSRKALKNPVSSILSLCVLGICAATLITFSQTNETPVTQEAAKAENVMPVGRTLTSADGRTIDVVITAKTATGIKAKKADGKEFELGLDKLSDADKAFVASLKTQPPLRFEPEKSQHFTFNYGWHVLIRVKDKIYAIRAEGIPSNKPRKDDPIFYAIKYQVVLFQNGPSGRTIVSDTTNEEEKRGVINCGEFKFIWRVAGDKSGYFYFLNTVVGRSTKVGLPPGAEYYNQQVLTLDSITSLDPKGWVALPPELAK